MVSEGKIPHEKPEDRKPQCDTLCDMFTGALDRHGYGKAYVGNRRHVAAHRLAYALYTGKDWSNVRIYHTCGNKGCVNVAHLTVLPFNGSATVAVTRRVFLVNSVGDVKDVFTELTGALGWDFRRVGPVVAGEEL